MLSSPKNPNALHHSAVNGADNLYVYDADTGKTKFVAASRHRGSDESGPVTTICLPRQPERDNDQRQLHPECSRKTA